MSFISSNTFGTLNSASDGSIVEHIFGYVSTVLQDFKGTKYENENGITNRLCKSLEKRKPSEYPFFFHHQNIENDKENTSTDFAVFGTYAYAQQFDFSEDEEYPLIKFEAKRLTTSLPNNREKEYVIGEYNEHIQIKNSGGIERFKNGRHGKNVTNAGIIGYVQSNSFLFWKEKIDNWIHEEISNSHDSSLSWDTDDILKFVKTNDSISEYISISKRKQNTPLVLRHLWINFN